MAEQVDNTEVDLTQDSFASLFEQTMAAGELTKPEAPAESVAPAIPNKEGIGDAGHRG